MRSLLFRPPGWLYGDVPVMACDESLRGVSQELILLEKFDAGKRALAGETQGEVETSTGMRRAPASPPE
eukprot:5394037-Heterocapsa_arctica.AAC.1